ncbi:Alcohol dehydrogenase [Phytophthora palmivora]|uniref:Alcohol dehydrogenase n=1 Tax=Phytophthora palmivora TaxID=4796 RepID=A0A2P4XXW4_9STRA|nr:Alcohol dehydrogenase [Phytophthora palmivora]
MPSYRRIQVHTYSTDFIKATEIVVEPELPAAGPGNVVVENRFLGINATDVNITNGGYGRTTLPVKCGLEAAGVIVEVGEGVTGIKVGDNVAYSSIGAFSEYLEVPATKVIKSPELSPALVPLTVCAVSASLALEKAGEMKSNETIFVSAAAGATGQFAVQLAKLAGNHVIGACSSDEKVEYLKSLGVDRPINYKKEDLNAVLKNEYPNGIDLAFEGVGGDMFKAVLDNIAIFGRIIVFGNCSHYHGDAGNDPQYGYQQNRKMQLRSASLRGFQRRHHPKDEPEHLNRLVKLVQEVKMPSFRRVLVHTWSTDFRKATKIVVDQELPKPTVGNVVVKNHFLGINATDINITNGGYGRTSLPINCGLEGVGVVESVAEGVADVSVGDTVAYQHLGAFAEYTEVPSEKIVKTPELSPSVIPLTVCGVSASLALEKAGEMKSNETVFVSAAAGATGQFVVQLAKLAGNHVIGACSSDEKVEYLKSLGVDRPVNYKKEDLNAVLKKEYPDGINLAFESVGGELFKSVLDNIAIFGRIIVFGNVSHYHGDSGTDPQYGYQQNRKMQLRSASLRGFLLFHHAQHVPEHLQRLLNLIKDGKLKAGIDPTEFRGLESIPDAIDRLYKQQNIGKLVIKL